MKKRFEEISSQEDLLNTAVMYDKTVEEVPDPEPVEGSTEQ